jgi:hypothetical protein
LFAVLVASGSFVTTLLGGYAALHIGSYRYLVLGLAAGLMLGVVGFDLLPEPSSQNPRQLFGIPAPLLAFVLGFLVLDVIEHTVGIHRGRTASGCWRHRGWSATASWIGSPSAPRFRQGAAWERSSRWR